MIDSNIDDQLPQSGRTAEEWLHTLLELITSSRDFNDLSVGALRRATGLPMREFQPRRYVTAERLTVDWGFRLRKDEDDELGARLVFAFFPLRNIEAGVSDLAQLNVGHFMSALEEAGFQAQAKLTLHGEVRDHRLSRDPFTITLTPHGGVDRRNPADQSIERIVLR